MSRWLPSGVAAVALIIGGCVAPGKPPEDTGASPHVGGGTAVRPDGPLTPDFASQDSADSGGEDPHGAWADIDIRGNIACALADTGRLTCWDDLSDRDYQAVNFEGEVSAFGVGAFYVCAVDLAGSVSCQSVDPDLDDYGQFDPPQGSFVDVDADWWQTCGLHLDHTIECWGWEWGNQKEKSTGAFTSVDVGQYLSCGVTTDGAVRCWGDVAGFDDSSVPTDRVYTQVTVGPHHACALDTMGLPYCWGGYDLHELQVPKGMRFRQVSAGTDLTCGVTLDRQIACWIADVATPDSDNVLQNIPEGAVWSSVAMDWRLGCTLDVRGAMSCWGSGIYGMWDGDVPEYPEP